MARAHKIYVISISAYDGVKAAFTVKHEMISWLWKQDNHSLYNGELSYYIESVLDGTDTVTNISDEIENLLKAKLDSKGLES